MTEPEVGVWKEVEDGMLPCLGLFDVRNWSGGLTDLRIVDQPFQQRTREQFYCYYCPLPDRTSFEGPEDNL